MLPFEVRAGGETIAVVVDASDAVSGAPSGHCEAKSAAVVVGGGTYGRTRPSGGTGPKSGGGGGGGEVFDGRGLGVGLIPEPVV